MWKNNIFLLLFLFCVYFSNAQEFHAIHWADTINVIATRWAHPQKDTTKCLLLVCDTSKHATYTGMGRETSVTNSSVWWITGYSVDEISFNDLVFNYEYLNSEKKPLPKNTVVWKSIRIE